MLNSPIEEIKSKLDIVEVIGDYIKLQKAGANYRALCPFHSEKTPSFFVSPARQIWHCFGACSEGGDIFKFIMKIEGVEFGDALRILAQRAGVKLRKQDSRLKTERQRLYEICELSCQFFEKQLEGSKKGRQAKSYILKRGVSEESIKKWRIGYAPDTWEGLSDFLVGKGYNREEIVKAGLAVKKQDNSCINSCNYPRKSASIIYDRFRGRIIFPVFDLNSQVIGFSGRVISQEQELTAKYINTPNTFLYDKSKVLYGLDKAKIEIRKKDFCILVEGNIDAVMVSQAGFKNVVAVCGTALTLYQLKVLKRYSENLITAFDMDIAGDSATKRGIDLAQSEGFNLKIITMPKNLDPADIIFKNPKQWEELLQQAKSILQFYFDTTISRFDSKTPEGKREISKILLPIIKRIPNKIEQSYWIRELAKDLEVKEEMVEQELKKAKIENKEIGEERFSNSDSNLSPKPRRQILEERVISLILRSPQLFLDIDESYFSYFSKKSQEILKIFKKEDISKNGVENLKKKISAELADFLDYLSLKSEIEDDGIDLNTEVANCLKEIKLIEVRERLDSISKEIRKAEEKKNSKEINKLTKEFNKLAGELI